jgi:deazaflavin-dependent oxidoreductase (nitroreductase family)
MNEARLDTTAKLGYLETIGRVSGLPRETEIWWVQEGNRIYLLSGGGLEKDWIRNFLKMPQVRFRVRDRWVAGVASIVSDPADVQQARELLAAKYYASTPGQGNGLPNEWTRTAVPVAITITA